MARCCASRASRPSRQRFLRVAHRLVGAAERRPAPRRSGRRIAASPRPARGAARAGVRASRSRLARVCCSASARCCGCCCCLLRRAAGQRRALLAAAARAARPRAAASRPRRAGGRGRACGSGAAPCPAPRPSAAAALALLLGAPAPRRARCGLPRARAASPRARRVRARRPGCGPGGGLPHAVGCGGRGRAGPSGGSAGRRASPRRSRAAAARPAPPGGGGSRRAVPGCGARSRPAARAAALALGCARPRCCLLAFLLAAAGCCASLPAPRAAPRAPLQRARGAVGAAFLERERGLPQDLLHLAHRLGAAVAHQAVARGAQREIGGGVVLEGLGRGGDAVQLAPRLAAPRRAPATAPCAARSAAARPDG